MAPGMNLTADERGALDAFLTALRKPDELMRTWQSLDLFDDMDAMGLSVRVGRAGDPVVEVVAQRYTAATKRPFPALLAALLSAANGCEIDSSFDDGLHVSEEVVDHTSNGFVRAEDVEHDETADGLSLLRIGTAFSQCPVYLIEEGSQAGAVLFSDGKGPDLVIGETLSAFLRELAVTGLSMAALASKRMS